MAEEIKKLSVFQVFQYFSISRGPGVDHLLVLLLLQLGGVLGEDDDGDIDEGYVIVYI